MNLEEVSFFQILWKNFHKLLKIPWKNKHYMPMLQLSFITGPPDPRYLQDYARIYGKAAIIKFQTIPNVVFLVHRSLQQSFDPRQIWA